MVDIKLEPTSCAGAPTKKVCLNEWLRHKAEDYSPGTVEADDNHEPVGELHNPAGELNSSADTADSATTPRTAEGATSQWNLRHTASRIRLNLSSPKTPGRTRAAPSGEDVLSAGTAHGCTGGTGDDKERPSRTTDTKRIYNRFAKNRKWLAKCEPELLAHLEELENTLTPKDKRIQELRTEIAKCEHGNFNTPYLKKLNKKCKVKDWGKTRRLGSWKEVCDLHGENVALAALKQGTLPYCPHPLLKPGHGVKWPDSHQFVLTETHWKDSWNTEDGVEADAENAQPEIDELFAAHEPPPELPAWDAFRRGASTGMPQPAPTPAEEPAPTPAQPEKKVVVEKPAKKDEDKKVTTAGAAASSSLQERLAGIVDFGGGVEGQSPTLLQSQEQDPRTAREASTEGARQ